MKTCSIIRRSDTMVEQEKQPIPDEIIPLTDGDMEKVAGWQPLLRRICGSRSVMAAESMTGTKGLLFGHAGNATL